MLVGVAWWSSTEDRLQIAQVARREVLVGGQIFMLSQDGLLAAAGGIPALPEFNTPFLREFKRSISTRNRSPTANISELS
jgi:hypothetical protein